VIHLERGSYAILSTPFQADESLDLDSLQRTVSFYVQHGTRGVVALAVMGEGAKVLPEERAPVIRAVVEAVGDVPVIVGVSGPGTRLVQKRAEDACALGAQAVLVTPPQTLGDAEYVRFFADVAKAGLPIILQDHPESTGIQLSVPTICRIVDDVAAIAAIKMEAPPTAAKIHAIRTGLGDRPCLILGGLGGLSLLDELAAGSDGTMTGFAFPEVLRDIVGAYIDGDTARAENIYNQFLPLLLHEATPQLSLGIRKVFLQLRGVIRDSGLRSPAKPIGDSTLLRTERLHAQYVELAREERQALHVLVHEFNKNAHEQRTSLHEG